MQVAILVIILYIWVMITRTSSSAELKAAKHIFDKELYKIISKTLEEKGFVDIGIVDGVITEGANAGGDLVDFKEFMKEVGKKRNIISRKLIIQKDIVAEDASDLVELRAVKEKILLNLLPVQEKIERILSKHSDITMNLTPDELLAFKDFDGKPIEYYLVCIDKRNKNKNG